MKRDYTLYFETLGFRIVHPPVLRASTNCDVFSCARYAKIIAFSFATVCELNVMTVLGSKAVTIFNLRMIKEFYGIKRVECC